MKVIYSHEKSGEFCYAVPTGQARIRVEAGCERAECGVGATEKRKRLLRMERDILKKTAAYFAKESL